MSANTSIKEGGQARSFGPVVALMVQGDDGKYYPWYPESERQLDTLSVTKNGVYQAKKMGVYGWRSVSVNVPTTDGVTGKDPETGEDVYVHPDPETGELVEDVLPVEIRVTTLPTKISYVDGETIDIAGMVVKAYLESGGLWTNDSYPGGTVPNSELTISPTSADAPQAEPSEEWDVSGTGLNAPVYLAAVSAYGTYQGVAGENDSRFITSLYSSAAVYMFQYRAGSDYYKCFVSTAPFHGESRRVCPPGWSPQWVQWSGEAVTVDGGTAYVGHRTIGPAQWNVSVSAAQDDLSRAAATAVLGGHPKSDGGIQTIGVSWPRTGDGAVLETTFDINVSAT